MPTDNIREISGIIALVSTTIIGLLIPLIAISWRGVEDSYFKLFALERKSVFQSALFIFFIPFVLFLVSTVVGIINPQLVPGYTILTLLVLTVALYIGSAILAVKNKVKKIPKLPKPDTTSLLYLVTFLSLGTSMFCVLFALFGIGETMLDIRIGFYWLDNYNLGRWMTIDAIFYLIVGIYFLGVSFVFKRTSSRTFQTDR
jgi:hypothetical protein